MTGFRFAIGAAVALLLLLLFFRGEIPGGSSSSSNSPDDGISAPGIKAVSKQETGTKMSTRWSKTKHRSHPPAAAQAKLSQPPDEVTTVAVYITNHLGESLREADFRAWPADPDGYTRERVPTPSRGRQTYLYGVSLDEPYTVAVTNRGYERFTTKTLLSSETGLHVQLRPYEGTSAVLHVRDAETFELTTATVTAGYSAISEVEIVTGPGPGEFIVDGIYPGEGVSLNIKPRHPHQSQDYVIDMDVAAPGEVFTALLTKPGYITGRVIDGITSNPVEGAKVLAGNSNNITTTTDATGRFTISSDQSRYFAKKGPLLSKVVTQECFPNTTTDVGDLPVYNPIPLSVKVVDDFGEGVPDVTVMTGPTEHYSSTQTSGTTNNKGYFSATCYPFDSLGVKLPDYAISVRDHPRQPLQGRRDITVTLGSGRITGKVTLDGKPVQGNVSVTNAKLGSYKSHASNPDGIFVLKGLSAGSYKIRATDSMMNSTIDRTIEVDLRPGELVERDIELYAPDAEGAGVKRVRVHVTDADGADVPHAQVTIISGEPRTSRRTYTNESGWVARTLRLKSYAKVIAYHPAYGLSELTMISSHKKPGLAKETVELQLKPGGTTLECTVLSDANGLPIKDAQVSLGESTFPVFYAKRTPMAGVFRFSHIPEGRGSIKFAAPGYSSSTQDIHIEKNGKKLELTEVLKPGGSVSVTMRTAGGEQVQQFDAVLTSDSDGTAYTATSNEGGRAYFSDIPTGSYQVVARYNGQTKTFPVSTYGQPYLHVTQSFE